MSGRTHRRDSSDAARRSSGAIPDAASHLFPDLSMTTPLARRFCLALGVAVVLVGCGKQDTEQALSTDSAASEAPAPAPQIVDVGAEAAVPDSERASGTVIVSNAKPSVGDSVVRISRRVPVQLPGAASAFVIEGASGNMEHSFLIVLDSAGAVKMVTHKWHNADNSVVAQTDCGNRTKCSPRLVGATPSSRTTLFTRLVLTGLDGNTAEEATSTLTGTVP
jgi:hypothetical protein